MLGRCLYQYHYYSAIISAAVKMIISMMSKRQILNNVSRLWCHITVRSSCDSYDYFQVFEAAVAGKKTVKITSVSVKQLPSCWACYGWQRSEEGNQGMLDTVQEMSMKMFHRSPHRFFISRHFLFPFSRHILCQLSFRHLLSFTVSGAWLCQSTSPLLSLQSQFIVFLLVASVMLTLPFLFEVCWQHEDI